MKIIKKMVVTKAEQRIIEELYDFFFTNDYSFEDIEQVMYDIKKGNDITLDGLELEITHY